ncbi:GNAT family N-acetyltransferase [Anaerococcus vaginalis]|uniref:GNAT family N-acetyltransferase n=1 Tax=Anaerococcus vaginalis TaxID=33037 RepID=UPI0018974F41|nr:GNAT family N-acetyltransferase [Anaerococcus vaginalis]
MIKIYIPKYKDLWFRERLLSDSDTMSYNNAWGGTIDFSESKWQRWYNCWIEKPDGKRFYRYLVNENNEFVGEIAYHLDDVENKYLASVIIYSKYRGIGYGREGLKLLCSSAKNNGLRSLYDNIALESSAINLFLECGFTEEYRTKDIVMLKKDLE